MYCLKSSIMQIVASRKAETSAADIRSLHHPRQHLGSMEIALSTIKCKMPITCWQSDAVKDTLRRFSTFRSYSFMAGSHQSLKPPSFLLRITPANRSALLTIRFVPDRERFCFSFVSFVFDFVFLCTTNGPKSFPPAKMFSRPCGT
jgi:hypothetical protein